MPNASKKTVRLGSQRRVVGGGVQSASLAAIKKLKPSKKTINKRKGSGNRARNKKK